MQVMSERDTVHKEMEKFQEEIARSGNQVKVLEQEKRQQSHDIETLRQEIQSALSDRFDQ